MIEEADVEVMNPTQTQQLQEKEAELEAQELQDKVEELLDLPKNEEDEADKMTSVSQLKPTASQLSKMSGRTYISQLQKQLDEERAARHQLEGDLESLKKVSDDIVINLNKIAEGNKE